MQPEGAFLVGFFLVEVVLPITEQGAGDLVPASPVEVAHPDDCTLIGVVELADHALDGRIFPALLGDGLLDLFLKLQLARHHHAGAVGRRA